MFSAHDDSLDAPGKRTVHLTYGSSNRLDPIVIDRTLAESNWAEKQGGFGMLRVARSEGRV